MINIKSVSKSFGKFMALDDISLTCNAGECIALIGPNGSGKTTLIKCILGMVFPEQGEIFFNETNILNNWKYRSLTGYMPQIGRYPDNMTVGQLIAMIRDIRQVNDLDNELYEAFDIGNMLKKRIQTLSGGTRQKVSAALAFMFKAPVIILDEPTAGLDPIATEVLKAKISKEKNAGKLILLTSHILSDLDDLVTEIIYMQDGKVKFHKPIEVLKTETGEVKLSGAIASVMMNNQ